MNSKKISSIGLLVAFCIIFTIISDYIQIGAVSINLSSIPIALGGMIFGPVCALILGIINGAFIFLAPSTMLFFNLSIGGTILTTLTKSALAGLIGALFFKLFREKHIQIGVILSSILTPLLNTVFFILYSLIFFSATFGVAISALLSVNFAIEIVSCVILTPIVYKILNVHNE